MTSPSLAAQMASVSVNCEGGADPRPETLAILREARVLASLREPAEPWTEGDEAYGYIAVSDDGGVLTLAEDGTITASALRIAELRERFDAADMTLWIDDPSEVADESEFDDREYTPEEVMAEYDESEMPSAEELAELFAPTAVKVREFSHRGPMTIRMLAPLVKADIDYAESGQWSLAAYETEEPSPDIPPSKAERPVITLNLTDSGGWFDVRTHKLSPFGLAFWPDTEQHTVPVLDLDTFTVPAAAETYRMLLTEGDGSRDDLEELAAQCRLDVDAAHQALIPETLGGVAGSDARARAFLAAFGVPESLIEAALTDAAATLPGAVRLPAGDWGRAIGDALVGGAYEAVALTRRDSPLARASRFLRENPAVGVAFAAAEFIAGVVATVRLRRGWKAIGIFLITDAIGDLFVSLTRLRRR